MAQIRERPDGRFEIRIYVPTIKGGKERKSFYADSKKEAKILANKIETDIAEGKYIPTDKTTLKNYINIWYEIKKKTIELTTQESYEIYINKHINPALGDMMLQKIKPLNIQDFYNTMIENGYSANTIKHVNAVLNQVFEFALDNDLLKSNPLRKVSKPKVEKFKPTVCKTEHYKKISESINDTAILTAIVLAARAGLRRGEILGLRWSDIDFSSKTISINQVLIRAKKQLQFKDHPKTERSKRTFRLDDLTIEILNRQKTEQDKNINKHGKSYLNYDLVVCRENGKFIRPDNLSEIFSKIRDKNKLDNLRLHDLRHFNATMMAKLGIDVKTASARFGDRTDTMLEIYTHSLEEMDQDAAAKIGTLLN